MSSSLSTLNGDLKVQLCTYTMLKRLSELEVMVALPIYSLEIYAAPMILEFDKKIIQFGRRWHMLLSKWISVNLLISVHMEIMFQHLMCGIR